MRSKIEDRVETRQDRDRNIVRTQNEHFFQVRQQESKS